VYVALSRVLGYGAAEADAMMGNIVKMAPKGLHVVSGQCLGHIKRETYDLAGFEASINQGNAFSSARVRKPTVQVMAPCTFTQPTAIARTGGDGERQAE
jgi:hypothetical protein